MNSYKTYSIRVEINMGKCNYLHHLDRRYLKKIVYNYFLLNASERIFTLNSFLSVTHYSYISQETIFLSPICRYHVVLDVALVGYNVGISNKFKMPPN